MPRIYFVDPSGHRRDVQAEPGTSVMQAAMKANVDEIYADCGGAGMCATCHVYVDPSFIDKLEPMSADENDMLDATAATRRTTSRLSCQIKMTSELDGVVIELPSRQI